MREIKKAYGTSGIKRLGESCTSYLAESSEPKQQPREKGGSDVVVTRVPPHEIGKVQRDSTSGKHLRKVGT